MTGTGNQPTPTTPAGPVARRGEQWLSEAELTAHLAALVRLENVGTLLGSGASVGPLGGQTMANIWNAFSTDTHVDMTWLAAQGFSVATKNAETLADEMEAALLDHRRRGTSARSGVHKNVLAHLAELQRAVLKGAMLNASLWLPPDQVDMNAPQLQNHRQLLNRLCRARQPGQPAPWVFTTNYDLAIEWAAESLSLAAFDGFTGIHWRHFAPESFDLALANLRASGEARFGAYNVYLAKVHGSLCWRYNGKEVVAVPHTSAYDTYQRFLSRALNDLKGLFVLPHAAKFTQTIGFALGEIMRRFAEFLARQHSALLVCGYSCNDEHINRLLASALQNPTLHMVIYAPQLVAINNRTWVFDPAASAWLKKLVALNLPQVTFVGLGQRAYFNSFVNDLPDPALFDDRAFEIRNRLKELAANSTATGT